MSDTPLLPAGDAGYTLDRDERLWPTVAVDGAALREALDA